MKIALVAHNNKKQELLELVSQYKSDLMKHELFSTQHTSMKVKELEIKNVKTFESGPAGGDVEVANMILKGNLDIVNWYI